MASPRRSASQIVFSSWHATVLSRCGSRGSRGAIWEAPNGWSRPYIAADGNRRGSHKSTSRVPLRRLMVGSRATEGVLRESCYDDRARSNFDGEEHEDH